MREDLAVTIIAIAIGCIAVVIAAAVFALFPLVRQVQQLARRLDRFLQSTEGDVHLTLGEIREAARNLNEISTGVLKNMDKVSNTADALEGFGETLRNTSDIIRTGLHPRLLSFGALLVGLRTGSWSLLRRIFLRTFVKRR
jgi:predicted PurR-regulated permease PerM